MLTIPTLIQEYEKTIFVNKVKHTYSLVSNALELSVAENGPPSTWLFITLDGKDENYMQNFSNHMKETVIKYFKPYLQTVGEGHESFGYWLDLKNGVTLYFYPDGDFNNYNDLIFTQYSIFIVGSINNNHSYWLDSSRDYSRKDFVMEISEKSDCAHLGFFHDEMDKAELTAPENYGCNPNIPKHKRASCGALLQREGWKISKDYEW